MTKEDMIEMKDPLIVSEYIFSLCGLWPLQPASISFKMWQVYLLLVVLGHLCATATYLNDIVLLSVNLVESIFNIMMAPTMYIIRLSKNMKRIVSQVKKEIKEAKMYEDVEEKRVYHRYNNMSYKFSKYATAFQACVVTMMFFRPLIHTFARSLKGHGNITEPYELPSAFYIYFDYEYKARIYYPVYIFATGLTYVAMYHIAQVSFVVALVLHVCGRFSVLSSRIKRLPTYSSNLFRSNIKTAVEEHLNLKKLSAAVNDSLYMILLIEYVSCNLRLALCTYVALVTMRINPVISINFLFWTIDLFTFLYVYSYIGELLTNESQKYCDALYSIDWPQVIDKGGRSLLICMINGQKTEYLTAGKFYKFSLFGYMDDGRESLKGD
ncbi:uncharacterized protein LOC144473271 isoform X2 [Augochlora pura]